MARAQPKPGDHVSANDNPALAPQAGVMAPAASRYQCELLTQAEMTAEIAALERRQRDDPALTRASIEALRRSGARLPSVPLRLKRAWSPNGWPLPKEWDAVPLDPGEAAVAFARLPAPYVGFVALTADAATLPRSILLDAAAKEKIATVLADALLEETER